MSNDRNYSQTWDLDSLLPHPQTEGFNSKLASFRSELSRVADESDRLPVLARSTAAAGAWGEFLGRYAGVAATASDLSSFIGCHAAAEAGNKQFQQLEATLASFEPDKERIATNVDLAEMVAEHRLVLDALHRHDPDVAESALRHHLRMVLSALPAIREEHPDYFEEIPR